MWNSIHLNISWKRFHNLAQTHNWVVYFRCWFTHSFGWHISSTSVILDHAITAYYMVSQSFHWSFNEQIQGTGLRPLHKRFTGNWKQERTTKLSVARHPRHAPPNLEELEVTDVDQTYKFWNKNIGAFQRHQDCFNRSNSSLRVTA